MSDASEMAANLRSILSKLEGIEHRISQMEEKQWSGYYEIIKIQCLLDALNISVPLEDCSVKSPSIPVVGEGDKTSHRADTDRNPDLIRK